MIVQFSTDEKTVMTFAKEGAKLHELVVERIVEELNGFDKVHLSCVCQSPDCDLIKRLPEAILTKASETIVPFRILLMHEPIEKEQLTEIVTPWLESLGDAKNPMASVMQRLKEQGICVDPKMVLELVKGK